MEATYFTGFFLLLSLTFKIVCLYSFNTVPEIKLSKWVSSASEFLDDVEDWETDFEEMPKEAVRVLEYGSTYVVSQHVGGIAFVCNASYPVEWEFHHRQHLNDDAYTSNVILRTARESRDISNPSTDRYLAILEMFGDSPTVSGNYSCRAIGHSLYGSEKNIYVFWDVSSPPYLVLSGRTVHVHSKDGTDVTIPCHVSHPEMKAKLLKEENGSFQLINEYGIQYDPKTGFMLPPAKNSQSIFGRYKCVTEVENDEVDVIVEKGSEPTEEFKEVRSPGTGVFYDATRKEIICCSRKGKSPPILRSAFCSTISSCQLKEHKLFQGGGGNGRKTSNGTCVSEGVFMRNHGILRCKGDGIDAIRTFYTDFGPVFKEKLGVYFNFNDVVPERMMHLTILHPSPPFYEKQLITVTCEGMKSYFADGHKWGILWKNGSITDYKPIEYIDDPRGHGLRIVDVQLHPKMVDLICYLPVWNSSGWIHRSVRLDVQKSFAPSIPGPPEEQIDLKVGDTEQLVECKSSGQPPGRVVWTKDGQNVPKRMIILNENGTSVLILHKVAKEVQGDYKCAVKNFVGQASKTYKIVVKDEDKPNTSEESSAWGTTAAVLVPILVVALIATAVGLVWKMQLQKKIVDHLSRVVFRDVERQNQYPT